MTSNSTCRLARLAAVILSMCLAVPKSKAADVLPSVTWPIPRVFVQVRNDTGKLLQLYINGFFCANVPVDGDAAYLVAIGVNEFRAVLPNGWPIVQKLDVRAPFTWTIGDGGSSGPITYPPKQRLLGFLGIKNSTHGMQVISIHDGSVAHWIGLQPGDFVIEINGRATHADKDYYEALAHSSRDVRLVVNRSGKRLVLTGSFLEGGTRTLRSPPTSDHSNRSKWQATRPADELRLHLE